MLQQKQVKFQVSKKSSFSIFAGHICCLLAQKNRRFVAGRQYQGGFQGQPGSNDLLRRLQSVVGSFAEFHYACLGVPQRQASRRSVGWSGRPTEPTVTAHVWSFGFFTRSGPSHSKVPESDFFMTRSCVAFLPIPRGPDPAVRLARSRWPRRRR